MDEESQKSNPPLFVSFEEFFEAVEPILERCLPGWNAEDIADYVFYLIDHRCFFYGLLPPIQVYQHVVRNVKPKDCEDLAAMPYQQFLRTRYGHATRDYVLYQRKYQYRPCVSTTRLQAHHRSYEHRGWEHEHLDGLTVLCQPCHQVFHEHRGLGS